MMKLTKQEVALAIEVTKCAAPEEVLARAKAVDPVGKRRIFAADFAPAIDELMNKGYTQTEAAEMLASLGCTFQPGTLVKEHRKVCGGRGHTTKREARGT